ncbi:MAG TPA: glycoside hydrolase family 15 protein [Candidatus Krumholzibacteria bacterium]
MRYGIIGNCNTAALVHESGAIDWCCLPRFDSASIFASILDPAGGTFKVAHARPARITQSYLHGTAILRTEFDDGESAFALTDFMPRYHDGRGFQKPLEIHRVITPLRGRPAVEVVFNPRLDYARNRTSVVRRDGMIEVTNALEDVFLYSSLDLGRVMTSEPIEISSEEFLVLSYHEKLAVPNHAYVREMMERTRLQWEEWARGCHLPAEWGEQVLRSAITLKLLIYEDTGAMVAAATTSLPETVGEVRNWDYRFCWLRDSSLVLEALASMGQFSEMRGFVNFLLQLFESKQTRVQILYRVDGSPDLDEEILPHLAGYRDSKPVRIGNAASRTRQNDIFGEVLNTIHLYYMKYQLEPLPEEMWSLVKFMVRTSAREWANRDAGIWEYRHRRRHFTHSKILSWVAVDRGVDIARRLGRNGVAQEWQPVATAIREEVLQRAWNAKVGAFTQAYRSQALDVAILQATRFGFLEDGDPRWVSTVRACEKSLCRNGYTFRYTSADDFGVPRSAFIIATLWMAKALDTIGDSAAARAFFEHMLARANHLGLLSEDVDIETGELLGNFPQAYSHMAVINTAHQLSRS